MTGSRAPREEWPIRTAVRDDEDPSMAVLRAVTEASGGDPTETAVLYDTVDPAALDRLFSDTNRSTRRGVVRFTFATYDVRLVDGEVVELRERS
ncbi:HalOD1 output domain-containing protein [Halosolutus amylolyticus]|uniref:HalOD1 output domain-containing protein n=1 Tax=Halosolutus amylolyticus TaxID=2932267 RepID=A0ABD5PLE7_9EURY|nr:HalOD1 output domain-containing protein [Halosolutus amylolyticus]